MTYTTQNFPRLTLVVLTLALGVPMAVAQKAIVPGSASEVATVPAGEHKKVEGTITGKEGERVTLRLNATGTELAVKLSALTQVKEKKTNPFRKGRKYQPNELTPGLAVEVEGRGDSDGALVAEKILLTNNDMKLARTVDARVAPIEENERKMSGQISELDAVSNAARGGAKAAQETADSAHARISELDDYEAVHSVTVHFKVGSAVLSEEAKKSLDDLARQTKDLKGFVIEVAGYASAEGSHALNQRLSRQRAQAVSEYLAERDDIPLRRIVNPTGYGVSHPVSDNATRSGRQENRRVEVKVLVSRGITKQASASQSTSSNTDRAGTRPDHPR